MTRPTSHCQNTSVFPRKHLRHCRSGKASKALVRCPSHRKYTLRRPSRIASLPHHRWSPRSGMHNHRDNLPPHHTDCRRNCHCRHIARRHLLHRLHLTILAPHMADIGVYAAIGKCRIHLRHYSPPCIPIPGHVNSHVFVHTDH